MGLFAEAEIAAGASVVACLLAAITGLFAWLTARDKLRYDVRMVQLEAKVETLTEDLVACHGERDGMRREIADIRAQNARQQAGIDSLTQQLGESKTDRGRLHGELSKIKRDLTGGGHPPPAHD